MIVIIVFKGLLVLISIIKWPWPMELQLDQDRALPEAARRTSSRGDRRRRGRARQAAQRAAAEPPQGWQAREFPCPQADCSRVLGDCHVLQQHLYNKHSMDWGATGELIIATFGNQSEAARPTRAALRQASVCRPFLPDDMQSFYGLGV